MLVDKQEYCYSVVRSIMEEFYKYGGCGSAFDRFSELLPEGQNTMENFIKFVKGKIVIILDGDGNFSLNEEIGGDIIYPTSVDVGGYNFDFLRADVAHYGYYKNSFSKFLKRIEKDRRINEDILETLLRKGLVDDFDVKYLNGFSYPNLPSAQPFWETICKGDFSYEKEEDVLWFIYGIINSMRFFPDVLDKVYVQRQVYEFFKKEDAKFDYPYHYFAYYDEILDFGRFLISIEPYMPSPYRSFVKVMEEKLKLFDGFKEDENILY